MFLKGVDVHKTSESKEYNICLKALNFNQMFAIDTMIY